MIKDSEVFAAVDFAKSKKRKSFRVSHLDTYTIAVLKYLARQRDTTVAEVIAEAVFDNVNSYMVADIVDEWLPASVRAKAIKEVHRPRTGAHRRSKPSFA